MTVATAPQDRAAVQSLRRLLWGRAISAIGDGLWFTVWALYFTRQLGLSAGAVAFGMAAAGAAALTATVPLGALADRRDARAVLVAVTLVRAAAMGSYLVVDGMAAFLLVTVVFAGLANGSAAVRTALVAGIVTDNADRVRVLAQQRVAQHVGYAAGAGLGALVLAADDAGAYRAAIAGNALTFLALAALTATVRTQPAPRTEPARAGARVVLRDRPYCTVVALTAVLSLCWAMLSTGLPLWIAESTELPLSLSGAVVVLSSIGIAVFQVPATRFARTTPQAARTATWSGLALASACLLLATTRSGHGAWAVAIVVVAAVLHLAGELGYVAAGWALSVGLMREDARGAYQGAAETATATVQIVGPGLFTLALSNLGAGGWLLVAAIFIIAGASVPAAARLAARERRYS